MANQALKDAYCRHLLHPDAAAQLTAQAYAATIIAGGDSLPICDANWVDITLRDATPSQLGQSTPIPNFNPIRADEPGVVLTEATLGGSGLSGAAIAGIAGIAAVAATFMLIKK